MTIHRQINVLGQGGNHTTWWLFKVMVDAGWTVPMSGSGVGGLYASSNVFNMSQSPQRYSSLPANGVGVGSEPWGYPYCWAVLEDPGGNRQVLLTRNNGASNNGDRYWGYYYSQSGSFGDGQTPGTDWYEDQNASAPDQATLWSRTSLVFEDGANATRVFAAADDTPSPEGEYGFIVMEFRSTNDFSGIFVLDDLRHCPPGQVHSLVLLGTDADGIVPQHTYNQRYFINSNPKTLTYRDTIFEYLANNCSYCIWWGYSRFAAPGGGQVSPDGKEYALPICVTTADYSNYIGFSRWFRAPSVNHSYPDTGGTLLYLFTDEIMVVDLLDGATTPTPI